MRTGNDQYEADSDERLMERVAGGDDAAFHELFLRWAPRLFGFFVRMTGDREMSKDLAQDTLIRVWRHRARYDAARPFRPWVFRIASNVHADLGRSWFRKLAGRTVGLFDRGPRDEAAPADRLAAPERERPDRQAERTGLRERLDAELARLPAVQRQAVVLRDLEGLTCREVADAMGKPLGSVLSWLSRGRASLRLRLEAGGGKEAWL
jgi:RNA polymerase sigma-70 factor (ECF subfamily)